MQTTCSGACNWCIDNSLCGTKTERLEQGKVCEHCRHYKPYDSTHGKCTVASGMLSYCSIDGTCKYWDKEA